MFFSRVRFTTHSVRTKVRPIKEVEPFALICKLSLTEKTATS